MPQQILLLYAHPASRKSRVNREMIRAVEDMSYVKVHDLYEMYPDFQINVEYEKQVLRASQVVVVQHPLYWYSAPPILKMWIDEVLQSGFAFGQGGDKLKGKRWVQVVSAGEPSESYRAGGASQFSVTEFLRPFEQTARYCGMIPHEAQVYYSTGQLKAEQIRGLAANYKAFLQDLISGRMPPDLKL